MLIFFYIWSLEQCSIWFLVIIVNRILHGQFQHPILHGRGDICFHQSRKPDALEHWFFYEGIGYHQSCFLIVSENADVIIFKFFTVFLRFCIPLFKNFSSSFILSRFSNTPTIITTPWLDMTRKRFKWSAMVFHTFSW